MVKTPKGWTKDKDRNTGNTLFEADGGKTVIELSPDFEEPFKSSKPKDWMFSVWVDGDIKRKHNRVFKTRAKVTSYAIKWMRKHPDGLNR